MQPDWDHSRAPPFTQVQGYLFESQTGIPVLQYFSQIWSGSRDECRNIVILRLLRRRLQAISQLQQREHYPVLASPGRVQKIEVASNAGRGALAAGEGD